MGLRDRLRERVRTVLDRPTPVVREALPRPPPVPAPPPVLAPPPLAIPPLVVQALPEPVSDPTPEPVRFESDLRTGDAPVRDAHLRPEFTTTAAARTVRILNEALGVDRTFPCEPGEYVLEAADRAGVDLPSSCRAGGCLTCTGRLIEGEVAMDEQYVLEEEQIAGGFRLLCCTSVSSDAVFLSHQEDAVS